MDELKDDPDWYVRLTAAEQGAFLDELINDENEDVRREAREQKKKQVLDENAA